MRRPHPDPRFTLIASSFGLGMALLDVTYSLGPPPGSFSANAPVNGTEYPILMDSCAADGEHARMQQAARHRAGVRIFLSFARPAPERDRSKTRRYDP